MDAPVTPAKVIVESNIPDFTQHGQRLEYLYMSHTSAFFMAKPALSSISCTSALCHDIINLTNVALIHPPVIEIMYLRFLALTHLSQYSVFC